MHASKVQMGILGDGQLALMLGEAAAKASISFLGLCESDSSPFASAFPEQARFGKISELKDLSSFAKQCSALTLENEFVKVSDLQTLQNLLSIDIIPLATSYAHFEEKLAQRTFYDELKISSPRWMRAKNDADMTLTEIEAMIRYPLVVKASRGGYDGNGVAIAHDRQQLRENLKKFATSEIRPNLVEEKVKIVAELSQGALFNGKGQMNLLPLVETVQRNGICEMVLSRPELSGEILESSRTQIMQIMTRLAPHLCGLFHFEFFLEESGRIVINEGAPRPHNSTHLTLNACDWSQFDLLVHFVTQGQLPFPNGFVLPVKNAAMINILGQRNSSEYHLSLPALPDAVFAFTKMYGKKLSQIGRKMGHVNLITDDEQIDLASLAQRCLKEYTL